MAEIEAHAIETIKCEYSRKIYSNEGNGFVIAKYTKLEDEEEFTATGFGLPENSSYEISFKGKWEDSKYGKQFRVENYDVVVPLTREGITAFLSSGLIAGVGPKMAEKIFAKFGIDTFDVLDKTPERLGEIPGIGKKKVAKIIVSYKETLAVKELVTFLGEYDVSINKATRIYKEFGKDSLGIIKKNPYKLCEIRGFGFKTVDKIARNLGYSPKEKLRIYGATKFVLDEAETGGHTCLPLQDLVNQAHELLNEAFDKEVVDKRECQDRIESFVKEARFSCVSGMLFKGNFNDAERNFAADVIRLLKAKNKCRVDFKKAIAEFEKVNEITLADTQKIAIETCLNSGISVITGGPGTGKTTIIKAVLYVYNKYIKGKDDEILLLAPTGRAAKRMMETSKMPASTIHSALSIAKTDDEEEMEAHADEELNAALVIVDEASMMDQLIAAMLLSKVKKSAKVILVGDVNQLPSVGAGNVLKEMISSGQIPTTVLSTIYRQEGDSTIVRNALSINEGDSRNLDFDETFKMFEVSDPSDAVDVACRLYAEIASEEGIDNVLLLSPRRTKVKSSVDELNKKLQNIINPKTTEADVVFKGPVNEYRVRDKVMQTKNVDGINNGDLGYIVKKEKFVEDGIVVDEFIIINFDGVMVRYSNTDMENVDLAYACTVHKSQGSECKNVIMMLLTGDHYMGLKRNLVYTGITRAKERVFIVGQKRALHMAVANNKEDKRHTLLGPRISTYSAKWDEKNK